MSSNLSSISAVAGSSSPSPGPTSGSGGFMSRVASLFSSSSTAKTSTPSSSRASSGTGGYGRKYGLKPHPKVTRDGIIKRKSYDTYRGRLRVPSGIYARRPTPEIIKGARYGELKGFLGNGEIIPAAEFEETVNPVTAEIFLDQDVLFETDHLSDEEESMDEDLRESSNLYYIAVNPDELPTYHFWRKRGEVDPMEHSKPSGLGRKEFTENTLDSDYEVSQDNSLGGSPKAMDTGKAPQTSRASQDDQMWDGRYGNEYDPTRSYYSNARNNLEWAESGQGFRFSSNGMAKTSRQRGESLVRSEDPTGWKQSAVNGKFLQPQRIRHHVDPLEFLDFYNEKANGNIMLRRRKPTPEDFTIRDQSYTPTTAQDIYLDHLRGSKSPPYGYVRTFGKKIAKYPKGGKKAPVTKKAKKTLIYCEQGALYLPDETYTTFVKLAKRILINRRFPDAEITKFGVDVNRRGNAREDTQHQTFDTNDEGAKELYQTHIVPNFNKPDFLIRVRPLSIDWNREIDPKRSSTQIKLNHKDIGYVYIEAGWKILQDSEMNSEYFVGEAIRFLFPERSGILQFRLETTNHGSHDIDVSQPMRALTPEVQRIFAKLAGFGLSSPPVVDIVERSPPVQGIEEPDAPIEIEENPSGQETPESVMILKPAREERAWLARPFNLKNFHSTLREQLGLRFPQLGSLSFQIWLSLEDYHANREPIVLPRDSSREIDFKQRIEPRIKIGSVLIVVPTFPEITVHYGPNRLGTPSAPWRTQTKDKLLEIARTLFRKDMTHPENKVYIQVAKYQSEWLSFDYSTPEDTFRKEVLHKIDDPDINIYPHDWNREGPFASVLAKDKSSNTDRNQSPPAGLEHTHNGTGRQPSVGGSSRPQKDTPPGYDQMIEAEKQKAVDRAKVDEIADELIRKISARTSDESVHNGPGGTTAIPPYGLALEPMIGTGPDIPTSYANVLTAAEVARLREENQELRNRILQRGDYCSDCDVVYKFGKKESHQCPPIMRPVEVCPFCQIVWTSWDRKQRCDHLERNHLKNDRPEAGTTTPEREICGFPDRRADIAHLDVDAKARHLRTHSSLSSEQQLPLPPSFNTPRRGTGPQEAEQTRQSQPQSPPTRPTPEVQVIPNPPKIKPEPGHRPHCPSCWTNVTSLGAQRREDHAQKCGIDSPEAFVDYEVEEGKRRKAHVKANGKDAPWPPEAGTKTAVGETKEPENDKRDTEVKRRGRGGKTDQVKTTEKVQSPTKGPAKAPLKAPSKAPPKGLSKPPSKPPPRNPKRGRDEDEDNEEETKPPKKTKTKINLKVGPRVNAPTKEPAKEPLDTGKRRRSADESNNDGEGETQPKTKTTKIKFTTLRRPPGRPQTRSPTKSPTKGPAKATAKAPTKRGRPKKK